MGLDRRRLFCTILVSCIAGLVLLGTARAATIPAWLDDAISKWNGAHAEAPITFVAIKEPWVWYRTPQTPEIGSKEIRDRLYGILGTNGYEKSQDEEVVTTAKPPVPSGPPTQVKCWSRSFMRSSQKGSTTLVDRMLTTLVCEERGTWSLGIRLE